jgi:hypothetical protein
MSAEAGVPTAWRDIAEWQRQPPLGGVVLARVTDKERP